jgi:L-asparagine transporter-like permease
VLVFATILMSIWFYQRFKQSNSKHKSKPWIQFIADYCVCCFFVFVFVFWFVFGI